MILQRRIYVRTYETVIAQCANFKHISIFLEMEMYRALRQLVSLRALQET